MNKVLKILGITALAGSIGYLAYKYFIKPTTKTSSQNNNNTPTNNPTPTKPTTPKTSVEKYCDSMGEPISKYLNNFKIVPNVKIENYLPNALYGNGKDWRIKTISKSNFSMSDTLTMYISATQKDIWRDTHLLTNIPVRFYYIEGNVGGIKSKVLFNDSLPIAAYFDYDTEQLVGYNSGIYFTDTFLKNKCTSIDPYILLGLYSKPNYYPDAIKNPFIDPYLKQAEKDVKDINQGKISDTAWGKSFLDFFRFRNQGYDTGLNQTQEMS